MDDLKKELGVYRTIEALSQQARERALGNPYDSYLDNIHVPALSKDRQKRRDSINQHFDRIDQALFDQFLVRLVSTFERCAFEKLSAAIGETRATLNKDRKARYPFSRARERLVKDVADFRNVSDIEALIVCYPQAPCEELKEVREYRNYVAHGREEKPSLPYSKMTDVCNMLCRLLQILSAEELD